MTTTEIGANQIKSGDHFLLEGKGDEIFRVKKFSISAPGKHGHSKVRIEYENIFTGSGSSMVVSGHDKIKKPVIEKERAQVLSITPKVIHQDPNVPDEPAVANVMNLDDESFNTYDIQVPMDMDENLMVAGTEVEIRVYESKRWIQRIIPSVQG